MSTPVTVVASTVLTLSQSAKAGKVLSCGKSKGNACRVRKTKTLYLTGSATPVPIPAASRAVTITFFHREGGVWKRIKTSTTRTSSTTGAWRSATKRVTSSRGLWRVQVETPSLNTLTADTSTYSYYKVP